MVFMNSNRDLPPELFQIATGSSEPIYRQMIEQLRRLIAGGQVKAGDGMPSVREVATALGVNPMTVSKAYSLLEGEGVLARRRGMGMIVAQREFPADQHASRLALIQPSLERVVLEAKQLELKNDAVIGLLSELLNK
jgi:GntR family transcriptional regulator